MDPTELKTKTASGLLSFPVTCFTAEGEFDEDGYGEFVSDIVDHDPAAIFAAGGTGEFFSLTLSEYARVIAAAVSATAGRVPVIAGIGYGTRMAVEFARAAENAGADGILVLPPYLINVEQDGLTAHMNSICQSIKIGVIAYNRDNAIFSIETLCRLADANANFIGFKDGHGDLEQITAITATIGDRLIYVGGMPTAEVYAVPYFAVGITTYSSAVFNFIPDIAHKFHDAVRAGNSDVTDKLLRDFFLPYIALRNRKNGYAVSIVKSGLRIVGKNTGPVRSPLTELDRDEEKELEILIRSVNVSALPKN